jgi:hypothetical protein
MVTAAAVLLYAIGGCPGAPIPLGDRGDGNARLTKYDDHTKDLIIIYLAKFKV